MDSRKRQSLVDLVGAYFVGSAVKKDNSTWTFKPEDKARLELKTSVPASVGIFYGTGPVTSLDDVRTVINRSSLRGHAFLCEDTEMYVVADGSVATGVTLAGLMAAKLPDHFRRILGDVEEHKGQNYIIASVLENYEAVMRVSLRTDVAASLKAASPDGSLSGLSLKAVLSTAAGNALTALKSLDGNAVLSSTEASRLKALADRWLLGKTDVGVNYGNRHRNFLVGYPPLEKLIRDDRTVFPLSGLAKSTAPESGGSQSPVAVQTDLLADAQEGKANKLLNTSDWDTLVQYVKEHPDSPESFTILHAYRGEPGALLLFKALGALKNPHLLSVLHPEDALAVISANEKEVKARPEILLPLGREALSLVLARYPEIKADLINKARRNGAVRNALVLVGAL